MNMIGKYQQQHLYSTAQTQMQPTSTTLQYSMNSTDLASEKVMREKTNNNGKAVGSGQQVYDEQDLKREHMQYLDQQQPDPHQHQAMLKLDEYYKSNTLNVIPETWEQESKHSGGVYDAQSFKKLQNKSQLSQRSVESKRSQMHAQDDTQLQRTPATASQLKEINENQKSRQEERRDKIEAIKGRLKQLFLNYCDYSIESGDIFITYTNFMKIIKDSQILDESKGVTQNAISILISRECNTNYNMIKHLSFEQYLNTILRIAELKYPEVFKKHPKSALKLLLKANILPLMKRIESAVENQNEDVQYSLYTVSELTLKLIIYNEDTMVIFSDILPLIKMMYTMYFEQEVNNSKGKKDDLRKLSLKSVMTFSRDFELCPYLVHQKACFLIWYSIANSETKSELANNPDIKNIVSPSQNIGRKFTLAHFIVFIYRLGVIYFNHSQDKPQEFNLIKKLLFFLRKLENSDGFKKFMSRLSRTYNDSLTFLPSKDLLNQILKAEGVDDPALNNPEEFQFVTKEAMISRIVDKHLYENLNQELKDDLTDLNEENEQFMLNTEDELKKLFEIYCAFGEPMNTKYLKSSKLFKMMREAGVIKGVSRLPPNANGAKQISLPEMDLAFKQVTARGLITNQGDKVFTSVMSGAGDQSQQVSGFLQLQSQMLSSRMKTKINTSNMVSNQSLMFSRTSTFEQQSHLIDKINLNKDRIDFVQFKRVLEIISAKVFSDKQQQQSYIDMLKVLLLPLLRRINDKRCIHNQMISQLLLKLDNQDMINLLTLLHRSIIDIYKVYADSKGYMNFSQYVSFCSDHDIFPDMATKACLHRIFHSLSFMNEVLGNSNAQKSMHGKSQMTSRLTQASRINSPTRQGQVQHEYIDEHLFVESIALIALYNEQMENSFKPKQREDMISDEFANEEEAFGRVDEDTSENSPIERVLLLIEKMSNSDGVYKKIRKGDSSNAIKCNLLEKKDLLELFRAKYPAYFKLRYLNKQATKKKGFDDIMEMSSIMTSVMTEQSQDQL